MAGISFGRGTFLFLIVQISFVISSILIQVILARNLGPVDFGTFLVVLTLIQVLNIVTTSGIPQSASRFIAMQPEDFTDICKASLSILVILVSLLTVILIVGAGPLSLLLGDASLYSYLQIFSLLIPLQAFYFLTVYYLNGLRRYGYQTLTMFAYIVVKTLFILFLIMMGWGILGAIFGFLLAPIVPTLLATIFITHVRNSSSKNLRKMAASISPGYTKKIIMASAGIIVFSASFAFLSTIDIYWIKRYLLDASAIGAYVAANSLARVFLLVFSAFGLSLYPLISHFAKDNEIEKARNYISTSLRYLLIIVAGLLVIVTASPFEIIDFFYATGYEMGGIVLPILSLAMILYTFFSILATSLIAFGKWSAVAGVALISMIFGGILAQILIPSMGAIGGGYVCLLSSVFSLVFMLLVTCSVFGRLFSFQSVLRVALSVMLSLILSQFLLTGFGSWVVRTGFAFALYWIVLFVSGEITKVDINNIVQILIREQPNNIGPK